MPVVNPPGENPTPPPQSVPKKPATPPPAKAPAPTSMNPTQWATLVAQDLGINVAQDPNAVVDILGWMPNEEPTSSWWGGYGTAANPTRLNPLNAGDIGQYGYSGGGGGLGGYPTLTNAAAATAQMIGQQNMSPILQALKSGASVPAFSQALETSPWASSHYGGRTFTANQAEAEAQGPTVTSTGAVGSGGTSSSAANAIAGALGSQTNPATESQLAANQAIIQSLQLTPAEEAAQQQILAQNYGYSQQQFGIQGQQQQLGISELQQQYNQLYAQNALAQQGFRIQAEGIQTGKEQLATAEKGAAQQYQQGLGGLAASGSYNTGSRGQLGQSYELQQEGFQQQQERLTQQFQGLTLSEAQQKSQFGYSQQQIRDGLQSLQLQQKSLGISEAQAKTQYQNALQQLGLNSLMNVDQLTQQIAIMAGGGYSPLSSIQGQLAQLIPGLQGSLSAGSPTGG